MILEFLINNNVSALITGFVFGVALCAVIAGYFYFFHQRGFSKPLSTDEAEIFVSKQGIVEEAERVARAGG